MKSIYSLLYVLLAISPLAHAEVVDSTLTCPKTITVQGHSFISASLSLSQTRDNIVDSVAIPYINGIPGGREGYVNPSDEPVTLQLVRSICAAGSMPQCDYERPSNADYMGPNGPGYRASSKYLSCAENSNNSFLVSSIPDAHPSNIADTNPSNNSGADHYTFKKADLGNIPIRSIVAKNDKLYVATPKNIFVKEKENFKNYPLVYYYFNGNRYDNEIHNIAVDAYGTIYATTNHAFLIGKKYEFLDKYYFSEYDSSAIGAGLQLQRQNIAMDNQGKVFLATYEGLILQEETQHYFIPKPNKPYFQTILNKFYDGDLEITSLYADEKGSIYVGTPWGLIILQQPGNNLNGIGDNIMPNTDVSCEGPSCISFNASIKKYADSNINHVNCIYVAKNGVIYLVTNDGLVIGTPYNDDYVFETISMRKIGITGWIRSLYVDTKGTIYIGYGSRPDSNQLLVIGKKDNQGNYFFNPVDKNELNVSSISSIYVDDNEQIYIGTDNGLYIGAKTR